MSDKLATWSAKCDLRWLFRRIFELLRQPEVDLVPDEKSPERAIDAVVVDDDPTTTGVDPPGFDMRTKRNTDRFSAELFKLYRDKPRKYAALARQNAKKYLEIDPTIPPSRAPTPDIDTNAPLRRARGVGTIVASHLKSTAKHMLCDGLKDFEMCADDEADEYQSGDDGSW